MDHRNVKVKKILYNFYEDQNEEIRSKDGNYILLGDSNRHVEHSIDEYEGIRREQEWEI